MDVSLIEQADLFVIGLQPRLDDLLDHRGGLALRLEFFGEHVLLARDCSGIEPRGVDRLRIGRRDMHRKLPAKRSEFVGLAGGFERHQDAHLAGAVDHRVVHIAADRALADRKPGGAAERHVLADLGDGLGDVIGDGFAAGLGRLDLLDVGTDVERHIGDHLDEALEQLVAGDEVGLGVDLDDDALGALDRDADQTFRGDAVGLLGSLGQALLAQPIDRGVDVARRLTERRLAIHHPRAGHLAQVLDHLCCDLSHRSVPLRSEPAGAEDEVRAATCPPVTRPSIPWPW